MTRCWTGLLLLAALAIAPAARLHAQPAPQHEPQGTRVVQSDSTARDDSTGLYTRIRLSSLTINGTYLPRTVDLMSMEEDVFVVSVDYLFDLDIFSIRSSSVGSSSALGLRLGSGLVSWWNPDGDYKHRHIGMIDKDLLSRYSIYSSRFRLNFLLGVTVRSGGHHVENPAPFAEVTVISRDTALKLGAEYSFALWNPVLSFHARVGCVLFGYETIEAASIGIGLSLGYQRFFNPAAP
jgi:hypothetical protein